jgi:hypothetical protein
MPLFYFGCPNSECQEQFFKMTDIATARGGYKCPKCDTVSPRTPKAPSSRVVEVVDNGMMAKRLERLPEAGRVFKEREKTNDIKRKAETGYYRLSPEDQEQYDEDELDNFVKKSIN